MESLGSILEKKKHVFQYSNRLQQKLSKQRFFRLIKKIFGKFYE